MKGIQIISTDAETRKNKLENKFQANPFYLWLKSIQTSNIWKLLSLGWPFPDTGDVRMISLKNDACITKFQPTSTTPNKELRYLGSKQVEEHRDRKCLLILLILSFEVWAEWWGCTQTCVYPNTRHCTFSLSQGVSALPVSHLSQLCHSCLKTHKLFICT